MALVTINGIVLPTLKFFKMRTRSEVEVLARAPCRQVVDELRARLDPKNKWRDPHNGGRT